MTQMRWHICDECKGSGRVTEDPTDPGSVHTCGLCNGKGKLLRGKTWEEKREEQKP